MGPMWRSWAAMGSLDSPESHMAVLTRERAVGSPSPTCWPAATRCTRLAYITSVPGSASRYLLQGTARAIYLADSSRLGRRNGDDRPLPVPEANVSWPVGAWHRRSSRTHTLGAPDLDVCRKLVPYEEEEGRPHTYSRSADLTGIRPRRPSRMTQRVPAVI
jgi:hypothetical protein